MGKLSAFGIFGTVALLASAVPAAPAPLLGPVLPAISIEGVAAPDLTARAADQRRALAEFDRLERLARRGEFGGPAVRQAFERVGVPGMPAPMPGYDPADLLDVPVNPTHSRVPRSDRR